MVGCVGCAVCVGQGGEDQIKGKLYQFVWQREYQEDTGELHWQIMEMSLQHEADVLI